MIKNIFNKAFNKEVDGIGLGVFRIAFFTVMFLEVFRLFRYRHFIFDPLPYLEQADLYFGVILIIWMLVLLFIIIGFKIRINAIINYILAFFIMGTSQSYEYHMFYAFTGMSFLITFMPVYRLSVDNVFQKRAEKVRQIYYFIPLFIGIALVYFDSIFHKLSSEQWMKGLGMWWPASHPAASILSFPSILDAEYVMYFLGYLTVVFEFLFIFLFFRKKFRVLNLIIGLGLHFGILICFPIPLFAIGVAAVYLLLVPVSFWNKFIPKVSFKWNMFKSFYYGMPRPSFDKEKLLLGRFLIFVIFTQLVCIYNSPLMNNLKAQIFGENKMVEFINKGAYTYTKLTKYSLGLTLHGVFMDSHFDGYDRIYKISYLDNKGNKTTLPIFNDNATPGSYIKGAQWVQFTFRINGTHNNEDLFFKGIQKYCLFYLKEHDLNFVNQQFLIEYKDLDENKPKKWVKGYLENQRKKPWSNYVIMRIDRDQFQVDYLK